MKVRVFTAFSGYDSQCLALDRLKEHFPDFDYELVGWAEIDKYAIQAHDALYPQWADRNYGDISKIDWSQVPDFDLFTYSSPCQDFSNAGLQRGGTEGSGTRSSLLWECRRAIVAKRPKYLLLENVAALVSQKFLPLFNKWQAELASYGYSNFAEVLNAKDFGVPQNRERVFLVSILGGDSYHFPKPFKLEKRLKDVLEENVEEKYYLGDKALTYIAHRVSENDNGGGYCKINGNVSSTLTAKGTQNWTGTFVSDPFNSQDGVSRTIKAQYANVGGANLIRDDACGATGVIENDKERDIRTIEEQGQERESSQP
jgi:DNA (cytosine-5)-methyltransferase 1